MGVKACEKSGLVGAAARQYRTGGWRMRVIHASEVPRDCELLGWDSPKLGACLRFQEDEVALLLQQHVSPLDALAELPN